MSKFEIDFIELAFLAEACIPPTPIARACFFSDLSEKYYHQMSQKQRDKLFEWIAPKLDLSNEDCQHFYARFNIHNQYKVKTTYHGQTKEVVAYKFNDKYHISRNQWIEEKYIESVSSITEP